MLRPAAHPARKGALAVEKNEAPHLVDISLLHVQLQCLTRTLSRTGPIDGIEHDCGDYQPTRDNLSQTVGTRTGMATPWHVDPFHRITVVVRGEALAIQCGRRVYRDHG